eukprot:CAMPEP_0181307818 /NCGR_PEP_ID=MMETSP1101-20121128/11101_1 /TAXON_ID=46948 /ORGANISM="Rhodomonas abbreviata, Strain Caron Lab Isolate" /LENGTH=399 /DNA_ID=CAMNT_0023414097 /DNA_START=57 /DNA_END=1256 /DNA_ORIENTATION=+
MPRVTISSTVIKTHQRLLATKAGLEVAEKKTMTQGELATHVLNSYNRQAKIFFENDDAPANLNVDILLHKSPDHFFSGPELWELYLDTKRDCMNVFNPKWTAKLNPDSDIPSGKDKDSLLKEILDELWMEKEEERVAKHIKNMEKAEENGGDGPVDREAQKKKLEVQLRPDDWQPLSWLTFVTLGAPAENPKAQLVTPSGNAPRSAAQDPTMGRSALGRKLQRKEEDAEKALARQKERDESKVTMLTGILQALQSTKAASTPPSPAVVTSPDCAATLLLKQREARRAELYQLYELSEGEEKALAKNALKNFLRDPKAYLDAPVDLPSPQVLFDSPPPPPPPAEPAADSPSAAETPSASATGSKTANSAKKRRVSSQVPTREPSAREGKGRHSAYADDSE